MSVGGSLELPFAFDPTDHAPARGVLVAGTRSGCGKTSVSLGLMAALARRGLDVSPFKAGPDFIDPLHHAGASGRPSHNLDGWMLDRDAVRGIVARNVAPGSVAVVEGVMGLFDGASGSGPTGSSEELARWLGLPVLLVADAASMARSAAAMVKGYLEFQPNLRFAGVVLNRVGSPAHAELLQEALEVSLPESANPAPLLGCLPRASGLDLPSRHLGLVTPEDSRCNAVYAALADWVEAALDLDALLASLPALGMTPGSGEPRPRTAPGQRFRLGVARDRAFCFCYPENLRLLEAVGAEIVFFSPLEESGLPPALDGLYLPGGYPELHVSRLSANRSMCQAVRGFCASGRPVYAECGGFLYLLSSLTDARGKDHALCGVYSGRAAMRERFRALGYRQVTLSRSGLFGPQGLTARGHEFHYSELCFDPGGNNVYSVADRKGRSVSTGGWLAGPRDNVLGSYVHLHFASCPSFAEALARACMGNRV